MHNFSKVNKQEAPLKKPKKSTLNPGFNGTGREVPVAHHLMRGEGYQLEAIMTVFSLFLRKSVDGPLGTRWLLDQTDKIERLTATLSDEVIQRWVKDALSGNITGEAEEDEPGSRRRAQSLVRRLESTLQTLIRVVHTLRAIDDHSTPEKREELLVTELAGAFSSGEISSVMQALERMRSEASGYIAWSSLMQARLTAWETDKGTAINTMIETTRHEAEKANKKTRVPRVVLSLSSGGLPEISFHCPVN